MTDDILLVLLILDIMHDPHRVNIWSCICIDSLLIFKTKFYARLKVYLHSVLKNNGFALYHYYNCLVILIVHEVDVVWWDGLKNMCLINNKLHKYWNGMYYLAIVYYYYFYIGDVLLKPIIQEAGKDISHWFDKKTREVNRFVVLTYGYWYDIKYDIYYGVIIDVIYDVFWYDMWYDILYVILYDTWSIWYIVWYYVWEVETWLNYHITKHLELQV